MMENFYTSEEKTLLIILEEDLKESGYRIDSVINYTTSLNPDFDQKTLKILKDQSIDSDLCLLQSFGCTSFKIDI